MRTKPCVDDVVECQLTGDDSRHNDSSCTGVRHGTYANSVLRQLADVFILNAGCSDIYPESAVKPGIQVGNLRKKSANGTYPILYCYLRAESEPVSTSVIAKLVLNLLKNALRQLRDGIQEGEIEGPAPVVPVFIDECQVVSDDAIADE
jgi:hypothetical protein